MSLPKINPKKETEKIVKFIKNTLKKQGFQRLVLGLSGGVDSATTAFLVAKAIDLENLYILLTPYKNQDLKLAKKVIQKLKIPRKNVIEVDTTSHVNNLINKLNTSFSKLTPSCCDRNTIRLTKEVKGQILKGNVIARTRMIVTFDAAKRLKALVCGTENRSEYLLGYFTRFGDEASDIEPIRHLYKTQIYQLAEYLGVPQEIIKAEPTAGLWPDQTDEKELGFSYAEADSILYLLFDKKMKLEEISIQYPVSSIKVKKVLKRVKDNLFKHQVPYQIKRKSKS